MIDFSKPIGEKYHLLLHTYMYLLISRMWDRLLVFIILLLTVICMFRDAILRDMHDAAGVLRIRSEFRPVLAVDDRALPAISLRQRQETRQESVRPP